MSSGDEPERRLCGAIKRTIYNDPGWECTGHGLIVVMTVHGGHGTGDTPVVLPGRALDVIEPESWWELPIKSFTGGDHYHLVVPRRPPNFRSDACLIIGDNGLPVMLVGKVDMGGGLYVG